jgi:hypothetical protein
MLHDTSATHEKFGAQGECPEGALMSASLEDIASQSYRELTSMTAKQQPEFPTLGRATCTLKTGVI